MAYRLPAETTFLIGQAAKRMSETTGQEAKPLHRLLEFDPQGGGFKRNQDDPLEGDVFVVDETSMVDLMLAHQFVRAIPRSAALILVGSWIGSERNWTEFERRAP